MDQLERGAGPDSRTMSVVRDMLAQSVKSQHGKWETNSRARIANVWREAHEGKKQQVPGYARGFYSPHELYGGGGGGGGGGGQERPVEVYHGLRNPQSARAAIDDDPLADRRAAPPGGNLDTNRPGASRPKLLRPRASDVFVREEPPPPGPSESILALADERGVAAAARAEQAALTSRKYFGTESFRRPGTIKRRRDLGADSGSSFISATSVSTTRTAATGTSFGGGGGGGLGRSASGMGAIPEWGVPARALDAALRAPPMQRSTAPTPLSSAAGSRRGGGSVTGDLGGSGSGGGVRASGSGGGGGGAGGGAAAAARPAAPLSGAGTARTGISDIVD